MNWYFTAIRRFADFKTRSSRAEFARILITFLVATYGYFIAHSLSEQHLASSDSSAFNTSASIELVALLVAAGMVFALPAAVSRRMRDVGANGLLTAAFLVLLVASASYSKFAPSALLLLLAVTPSKTSSGSS